MRIKHLDKKNALSIISASKKQMIYTLKLISTDESAFNIIRNIYECFRMLGDALLVSEGKLLEDHIEQIKTLEKLGIQTTRPIKIVDSLRKMRHNINYYGYTPSKLEADDAISFAKECYNIVFEKVKEIIDSQSEKRFI